MKKEPTLSDRLKCYNDTTCPDQYYEAWLILFTRTWQKHYTEEQAAKVLEEARATMDLEREAQRQSNFATGRKHLPDSKLFPWQDTYVIRAHKRSAPKRRQK